MGAGRTFSTAVGGHSCLLGSRAVWNRAPFTVAAWVRPANVTGGCILAAFDSSVANKYFRLELKSTGTVAISGANTTAFEAVSTTTWSSNTWVHAAGTFASSTFSAYLNGGGKGTTGSASVPTITTADKTSAGRLQHSAPTLPISAVFGTLAVWNGALTDEEILQLERGEHPKRVRPNH